MPVFLKSTWYAVSIRIHSTIMDNKCRGIYQWGFGWDGHWLSLFIEMVQGQQDLTFSAERQSGTYYWSMTILYMSLHI